MIKILKNSSGSNIDVSDTGVTVFDSIDYTIPPQDYALWAASDDIVTAIANGSIVVNDGNSDLSIAQAVALIQGNFVQSDVVDSLKQNDRIKIDVVGSLDNGRVKVSDNDTTSEFLDDKILPADNKIAINIINEGLNEAVEVELKSENINTSELNNDEGFLNETSHDSLPQDNPHNVNKTQVGLGNVDNTSDLDKPVSTAQQSALDLKYDANNPNGYETPAELNTRDISNRDRGNHTGTQLSTTISDFTNAVKTAETTTQLQILGNTLRFTDEDGVNTDIDLSVYLDDTNLARLVSGSLDAQTGIVTFTRDDSSTFTIDLSPILSIDVGLQNEIHVGLNGSDSTGNGTLSKPYRTLKAALDYVSTQSPSSTNPFSIKMGPGQYDEDPMICPQWVLIRGYGPRTRINANNANANLLTIPPNSSLRGLSFQGVTNSSNYCVVFTSTNGGVTSFIDVFTTSCSNGILVESSSGTYGVTGVSFLASNITGATVSVSSNSRFTLQGASINGNGTTTKGITVGGNGEAVLYNARLSFCNIAIESTGTGEINLNNIDASSSTIPFKRTSTSPLIINGGDLDATNIDINSPDNIEGYFINRTDGETQLRVNSELSVGIPSKGRETSLGEGDSYRNGLLAFTFNGSSFTNVTSLAIDPSSTFSLPNTSTNTALYITTAFPNTTPLYFYGLKVELTQGMVLGSGNLVSEYWNGSSWVEFNTMSEGEVDNNYRKYAESLFQRASSEQVFFDNDMENDWTPNDPVGLGVSFRWVRFRISSSITTVPTFSLIKIHTNRTEINEDGYVQYFGKARRYKTLTSDLVFEAASNSPSNQDIYLSDNLPVGKRENEFFPSGLLSSSDQSGAVFKIPGDLDSSCKFRVRITYVSDDTGTARFRVYWATSPDGAIIYQNTSSPSTYSNERQVFVQDSYPTSDRQKTVIVNCEIPEAIARYPNGDSDLLWIGLRIDSSTTVSPITLVNVTIEYVSNESGGHLE